MELIEHKYLEISLPGFVNQFKDSCLSYVIPLIDSAILYVESIESPVVFLLLILIFVQLIRTAIMSTPAQPHSQTSNSETNQINKEIKDLKKELKSIQTMLHQLKSTRITGGLKTSSIQHDPSRIINLCKDAWEKRQAIASEIMDWQLKIIKEVTKLKNKSRIRSPSKISSNQLNASSSNKSYITQLQREGDSIIKDITGGQSKSKEREKVVEVRVQQKPKEQIVEENIINIKLQGQFEKQTFPTINIHVDQYKTEQGSTSIEKHQSISISNNTSQPKTKQEVNEKGEPEDPQPSVPVQVPSLPAISVFPKPPIRKPIKRVPPPKIMPK